MGQTIILDSNQGPVSIQHFYYLPDSSGSITIGDIIDGKYNKAFKMRGDVNVLEDETKAWWIKFTVKNNEAFDRQWVFNYQNWSYVDFYIRNPSEKFVHKRSGHLLPFKQRDLAIADYCFISTTLESGIEYECIVRLDSEFNGLVKANSLSFKVSEQSQIEDRMRDNLVITSVFVGVFLVMLVYNVFLFFTTREKMYRFYLLTIFILFANLLQSSGILLYVFSFVESLPNITKIYNFIEPHVGTIAVILFFGDFFNVKERYPWWYKFMKFEVYYTIGVIILLFIDFDIGIIFGALNSIPVPILIFSVAIKSVRAGYPSSVYFLIGHVFWYIGGIISMLSKIGVIPYTDFGIQHSFAAGSSIEMVLFAIALGNRINTLKYENEKNQKRIILQLEENQELQTKVNRELEQKVMERVKQISVQNKEIEEQKKTLQLEVDRSDRLLLNILPKEVAEELKLKGHATPKFYERASILFADIQGFSTMVGDISPNDLVKDLDYCFTGFDYIITKHNLEKIKTIGDAYMCAGGLPKINNTHPVDTVRAALEMLTFMEKWKEENPVLGQEGLVLRIGINTGPVVSGVVGKKKFQYDIWGDTVNLASRMESSGKPGMVNISETTYNLVKDHFDCVHRGKVKIKNMGEVDMYSIENEREVMKSI